MKKLFIASSVLTLSAVAGGLAGALSAPDAAPADDGKGAAGPRLFRATAAFLDSLGPDQKARALLEFKDEERFNWHFIPRDRKGVALKDLGDKQRAAAAEVLRAGLSAAGAKKAEEVMSLEDVLREIEGPSARFRRDPLLYYVTVFSQPSKDGRWGVRIEGHHLSINWTLQGEALLSGTPVFYGANPAIVRSGPHKGLRVLAGTEDLARKLVGSLGPEALAASKGEKGGAVPEEVPGHQTKRYAGPYPEGVAAAGLSKEARDVLAQLIREYTRNLAPDLGAAVEKEIGMEELKDVHFAWRGGIKESEPHSYLIHGPTFVINYSNVQNDAAHVHSAFRSLKGDFGLAGADG
jgi:hypothetical protein